jgi:hypothetical protein
MISIGLALELKSAGLVWRTTNYDFFAIPDRGFDDRVFVLADMMAYTELVQGWPVVAFHGTAEWALDYILTSEVVWVPTEEQLREILVLQLDRESEPLTLSLRADGYHCSINFRGERLTYSAATAGEAYALALLHVLRSQNVTSGV